MGAIGATADGGIAMNGIAGNRNLLMLVSHSSPSWLLCEAFLEGAMAPTGSPEMARALSDWQNKI